MKILTWLFILKNLSFSRITKFQQNTRANCRNNYINLNKLQHDSFEFNGKCFFVTREKKFPYLTQSLIYKQRVEKYMKTQTKKYKFSIMIEKMFKWNDCIIICDIKICLCSFHEKNFENSFYFLFFLIME